jgi:hypothetical protein
MRVAYLVGPVAVGAIAGTSLSVGDAIALVALPAMAGLVMVTEINERLRQRRAGAAPQHPQRAATAS